MAMRPFQSTMPLDEARAIIARAVHPIAHTERIPLLEATGRVLARAAVATADVPPFSRASMDGYAVRAADTAGATRDAPAALRCVEQVFTAQIPRHTLGPGECSQVATGAPMPEGADAVVMVEETQTAEDQVVQVMAAARAGQNIGRQGADIERGQTVLDEGTVLTASRIGALAAIGLAEAEVYVKPRVAILSTGNEIVEPGSHLAPGQIFDINKYTLAAVVADHGGLPVPRRSAADSLEDLDRAVTDCLADDVLVFSGGSSVGERDLIFDAFRARGEVLFHGISVKPGKPTAFGLIEGRPVFGMPGYPASCLSNAYILLAPALRLIARLPPALARTRTLPLGARVQSTPDRHQFYTVRIEDGRAVPAFKASGDITSMSRADGYIEIPSGVAVIEAGALVEVTLF